MIPISFLILTSITACLDVAVSSVDRDFGDVSGTIPSTSECYVQTSGISFRYNGGYEDHRFYAYANFGTEGYLPKYPTKDQEIESKRIAVKLDLNDDVPTNDRVFGVVLSGRRDWKNDYPHSVKINVCNCGYFCRDDNGYVNLTQVYPGPKSNTARRTIVFSKYGTTIRTIMVRPYRWEPGANPGMRIGVLRCKTTFPSKILNEAKTHRLDCNLKGHDKHFNDLCSKDICWLSCENCEVTPTVAWGYGIYTYDTPICYAAINFFGLKFANSMPFKIYKIHKKLPHFKQSSCNGIVTSGYTKDYGAYSFIGSVAGYEKYDQIN